MCTNVSEKQTVSNIMIDESHLFEFILLVQSEMLHLPHPNQTRLNIYYIEHKHSISVTPETSFTNIYGYMESTYII